jgi:hypothetical protein
MSQLTTTGTKFDLRKKQRIDFDYVICSTSTELIMKRECAIYTPLNRSSRHYEVHNIQSLLRHNTASVEELISLAKERKSLHTSPE